MESANVVLMLTQAVCINPPLVITHRLRFDYSGLRCHDVDARRWQMLTTPQAGAACGRTTWPFREKIREITNAPIRLDSPGKTTSMVERLGVGEFDMGGSDSDIDPGNPGRRPPHSHPRQEGGAAVQLLFHAEDVPISNTEPRICGLVRGVQWCHGRRFP